TYVTLPLYTYRMHVWVLPRTIISLPFPKPDPTNSTGMPPIFRLSSVPSVCVQPAATAAGVNCTETIFPDASLFTSTEHAADSVGLGVKVVAPAMTPFGSILTRVPGVAIRQLLYLVPMRPPAEPIRGFDFFVVTLAKKTLPFSLYLTVRCSFTNCPTPVVVSP